MNRKVVGGVLIFFLLLLSYSPLKQEIHANATSENATRIDQLLDTVFPLFWGLFLLIVLGVTIAVTVRSL